MFFSKQGIKINTLMTIDVSTKLWCNEAVLIEVQNGKGALKSKIKSYPDNYYGNKYLSALTLNDIPLIQCDMPSCPTCAGMLATGYGIDYAKCKELSEISDSINAEYSGIENAVNNITPLLSLLQSGFYVIADIRAYPTDGNGNYFWAVPNEMKENIGTSIILTDDYECVGGVPVYLYPTQNTDRFNQDRLNYYLDLFQTSKNYPRAISYQCAEFINILLDGHHKASAAALLGKEIPCLTIIPFSGFSNSYVNRKAREFDEAHFSDISIKASLLPHSCLSELDKQQNHRYTQSKKLAYEKRNLVSRKWDKNFIDSALKYPRVEELAEEISLEIYDFKDELVERALIEQDNESVKILKYAIRYYARNDTSKLKSLAFKCTKIYTDDALITAAFKALASIKNDKEIEQFFVDFLVEENHNDIHSVPFRIANSYWD